METLNLTTKEANKQIKTIKAVWFNIETVLNRQKDYLANSYFMENYNEEKEHCKFKPSSVSNYLSIKEGAILFSVKWILDSLLNGFRYEIKDVLTCRISAIKGEAIAKVYGKELIEALKEFDLKEVLSFDYVTLQNVKAE